MSEVLSKEAWLSLYYPTTAEQASATEREALEHSIRKWKGLRDLEAKGLKLVEEISLYTKEGLHVLDIDGESCALCFRRQYGCLGCSVGSCGLQYRQFNKYADPEPMIKLLEEALERVKKEGEN